MIPLQDLLSRFKNLTNTEKVKKELIVGVIKDVTGVEILVKNIIFSKNIIILKVNPLIKTEIALKKHDILNKLRKMKGVEHFINIT